MKDAELLNNAIKAAILAGKEIMQFYNRPIEIQQKEDQSPVTQADLIANKIIIEELKQSEIPIISEESYYSDIDIPTVYWIIDPLDGTKEFINKNGEFTVNIALIKNEKPTLGVVYAPAKGLLYFASPETLAMKVKVHHNTILQETLEALPICKHEQHSIRIVASRSHLNKETEAFIKAMQETHKQTEVVYAGSSLKLCLIAEGLADIYPRFGKTMEWDTAAGHSLLLYTNADMYNAQTIEPIYYGKQNLINPDFVAIRKNMHWH